ncbi:MAG: helix-hairpin-helix domain-containing protein [Planctomycetes bacterium]|nr:helix-hairpin-helix domain-containing protein [Planctomycetota bacterium]
MTSSTLRYRFTAVLLLVASARTWIALGVGNSFGENFEAYESFKDLPPLSIDLATASWPELTWLPGIGEQTARGIVAHRAGLGIPVNVDSLHLMPGVGSELAAQLPHAWLLNGSKGTTITRPPPK